MSNDLIRAYGRGRALPYGNCRVELTVQDFSDSLAALSAAIPSAVVEKRAAPRAAVYGCIDAVLSPKNAERFGRRVKLLAKDLSTVGIGIYRPEAMKPGDGLIIQLPRAAKPPLMISCFVVHCAAPVDGIHLLGLRFHGMVSAELAQLIVGDGNR